MSPQESTHQVSTTEQRNTASSDLDRMSSLEVVQVMNAEDHKVADAVATALPPDSRGGRCRGGRGRNGQEHR